MKTIEQLTAELAALTTERDSLKAANVGLISERDALKTESAGLKTDKTTLTAERDSLKTERDSLKAENEKLKGEAKTVEQAVAAKVVELGLSDKGGKDNQAGAKGAEKLTATQKVLKARGLPLDTKVAIGGAAQAGGETDTGE